MAKELFRFLKSNWYRFSDLEKASAFFILSRITFGGGILSTGYSEIQYQGRFTESAIKELSDIGHSLTGTKITNLDYQKVVEAPGDDVFVFCCLPGTKIRMKDERLLNIQDVKIGDTTFLGGNVLDTIERDYIDNIYEFEVMGIYDNLSVTKEHPLGIIRQDKAYEFRYRKKDGSLVSKFKSQIELNNLIVDYIQAKDIRIGDFLLIPCYAENIISKTTMIGDVDIKCDEYFGLICGLYLAEGGTTDLYIKEGDFNNERCIVLVTKEDTKTKGEKVCSMLGRNHYNLY